jgi:RNA polymerase sigma-70 factor (ECF subfamily)
VRLPPEDVADIFQEVFCSVATHIGTFRRDRPGDTFRGWLLTITQNKIRDHIRRQAGLPRGVGGSDAFKQLQQIPELLDDLDDADDANTKCQLLHRSLDLIRVQFAEQTWEPFWRVVVMGQSPAAVALDLGITVNAVYKAKSRVLRRLREELGELIE